jgi:hypothetical protein
MPAETPDKNVVMESLYVGKSQKKMFQMARLYSEGFKPVWFLKNLLKKN